MPRRIDRAITFDKFIPFRRFTKQMMMGRWGPTRIIFPCFRGYHYATALHDDRVCLESIEKQQAKARIYSKLRAF
jgi:hypothetical protein